MTIENTEFDENASGVESYTGDKEDLDDHEQNYEQEEERDRRDELVRIVTNHSNALERIETLSRELSRHTYKDGPINIDPNDFDLAAILESIGAASRRQGLSMNSSGLAAEGLTVSGVDQSFSVYPTVGDILSGPVNAFRSIGNKVVNRNIIDNFNAVAKHGEMVLVIGRPGAGCTTLLKSLSGTDLGLYKGVSGNVTYDGIGFKEMVENCKSDLIYCPELDTHFPHLTVEQTLKFAIGCRTPRLRINDINRKQYIQALMDILTTVFGLRHTHHTKVGNDYVRGVSGGERKRVSIAEALACRGSIYCWDNATRGLDASTALEYAQAIRISTNLLKSTAFVAIYQAGENIYKAFDKVTVLYEGKQIYFGPVEEAKAYFVNMGFDCPPRQATAEFLTAVTDPSGRFPRKGYENIVPRTAEEFERMWLNSKEFSMLKKEIEDYKQYSDKDKALQKYAEAKKQSMMKFSRSSSRYTVNIFHQVKLCCVRSFQATWGDKAYTVSLIVAAIVQGLVAGSLYYNTPNDVTGAFSRGGAIFFSVLYVSLMSLAEVTSTFSIRPIILKQKNYSMYHPASHALSHTVTAIPVALGVTACFCIVIFFLVHMRTDAGNFFIFLLFVFLLNLVMSGLFSAIASLTQTISSANAISGILILASFLYSSYMIQRPSMHPWFKWISYINPIYYAFEAVASSEFHGRKMACIGNYLVPNGKEYTNVGPGEQSCAFKGSVVGQDYVSGDSYIKVAFTYSYDHVWRNFGILIAFFVFFTGVKALGTEFVRPVNTGGDRLLFLSSYLFKNKVGVKNNNDIESGMVKEVSDSSESDPIESFDELESKDIFSWKDVNYVVKVDGVDRTLLDNVSGYCVPGTLTALMGESGAGKTTLLNCLAQRLDVGVISGDMLVNGLPLTASFSRRTGYVQQQDIHLAECTVRESLLFSARLRRPNSVPDKEKKDYVEKIIKALDMTSYADAIVGSLGDGLNVEQRKKLSIGVELVAKPSLLLFLDEPTSGLDSQSSWGVVQVLCRLAAAGQSILCTIHQPSATLFENFDRLLLLKKGGQTVYFGDIGENSSTLLSYFEKYGAEKCLKSENPAEYILNVIGAGANASTDRDWHDVWLKSSEKQEEDMKRIEFEEKSRGNSSEEEPADLTSTYAVPLYTQFFYVLRRNALTFWRNPDYIMAKLMLMTLSGLFIGFTFFGLKDNLTGMQNAMFAGFIAVVVSAPVINQIEEQAIKIRDLYEAREKMSNTYHFSVMILSQILNEIPYLVFGATLMFVSLYFPTQSNTSGPHSGVYYLTQGIFLQGFVATFGLLILFISPDLPSAAIITSFFYTFVVVFCGVVQPVNLMPGFWTFMNKVSPYTYFISNLVAAMLHKRKVVCSKAEAAIFNPPEGQTCGEYASNFMKSASGYISNANATSSCEYCTYANGDEYLTQINYKYSYIWRNVGFFVVYIVFNAALGLFLYWLIRNRKGSLIPKFSFLKKNRT